MGDERDQEAPRTPLWPPESEPAQPPRFTRPPRLTNTDAPPFATPPFTTPPFAAPTPAPEPPQSDAQRAISESPTTRMSAAPAPSTPAPSSFDPTEAQTQRYPTAPVAPTAATSPTESAPESVAPAASPRATGAPAAPISRAGEPLLIPTRRRQESEPIRRLGLLLGVVLVLLISAGGLYAYAASLASAPQHVMADYCSALKRADYPSAYSLLSGTAKTQQTEAQFVTDSRALDTLEGRVTGCSSSATEILTPLSMLGSPRSLLFNATLTRAHAASGQIALTRDAVGWHVAALSTSLLGIDLGPLDLESALCSAFGQRSYNDAFRMLSTPYQREQGDANTFARAFGATLTITGCAPNLKTYKVNGSDQKASDVSTLTVSVAQPSGSPSSFTLPATLTFVREATGWRVDSITPLLNQ